MTKIQLIKEQTMSETAIINELKKIIAEELDVNLTAEEIDENVSLFEEGLGFDSIAIVELISSIEERFKIEFTDSELNPEHFSNLTVLADFIRSKKQAPLVETAS
jgi:acyl carrier protein